MVTSIGCARPVRGWSVGTPTTSVWCVSVAGSTVHRHGLRVCHREPHHATN
jgi:hypothetical protein